ncbi:EF hand [Teladorsagia circumcincta]|uniref:EF hand n=1 Tax=Teladorsagia circumcincta TaxID=45464 RepID=A0A2G9UQ66_TELCI|nr:EF hand [Teladorsagia circumcincta]
MALESKETNKSTTMFGTNVSRLSPILARKELNEYKQLFNMFDTDGSGAIGNEELKQAMFSIGMHANEAEIDNVIREIRGI